MTYSLIDITGFIPFWTGLGNYPSPMSQYQSAPNLMTTPYQHQPNPMQSQQLALPGYQPQPQPQQQQQQQLVYYQPQQQQQHQPQPQQQSPADPATVFMSLSPAEQDEMLQKVGISREEVMKAHQLQISRQQQQQLAPPQPHTQTAQQYQPIEQQQQHYAPVAPEAPPHYSNRYDHRQGQEVMAYQPQPQYQGLSNIRN